MDAAANSAKRMTEREQIVQYLYLRAKQWDDPARRALELEAMRIAGGEHLLVGTPLDPFRKFK